jgi:hypothetical protein
MISLEGARDEGDKLEGASLSTSATGNVPALEVVGAVVTAGAPEVGASLSGKEVEGA